MRTNTIVAAALAVAASVSIAQAQGVGQQPPNAPLPFGSQPKPARPRFPLPEAQARALFEQAAKNAVKPKIVCGTMVIPADPKIDPQIVKPVPDSGVTLTLRQVTPSTCR
jgi:hypothetical protein